MNVGGDGAVDNSAIDPEVTTVPGDQGQSDADTSGAEGGNGAADDASKEPRVFSQEELDKIVEKRIARERTKFAREQEIKAQEEKLRTAPITDIVLDDFDSPEEYAEALAQKRLELLQTGRQAIQQQQESLTGWDEKEAAALEKYPDFAKVALNNELKITENMGEAILGSDVGTEVLYHLGQNPAEAERISKLSVTAQVREILRLEGVVADKAKQQQKTSAAPAPIDPIGGRPAKPGKQFDPNDASFLKTMSTTEWIEADRAYQRRLAEGK